eukprot:scaffold57749_cov63-Phaeocystis_antarctica.AAC.3
MAVRLPHVPPPSPRLDAEGELAAALQELEGLGRLGRSASVMAMLPMPLLPGDYAAREVSNEHPSAGSGEPCSLAGRSPVPPCY